MPVTARLGTGSQIYGIAGSAEVIMHEYFELFVKMQVLDIAQLLRRFLVYNTGNLQTFSSALATSYCMALMFSHG